MPRYLWLLVFGLGVGLGCGKDKDAGQPQAGPGPAGGGPAEPSGDPKPEAKLTPLELYENVEKYGGKWVIVTARIPRILTENRADGRVSGTLFLHDDTRQQDSTATFEPDEWAKVPKLEDGVYYEVMGQANGSKTTGARLHKARFVGRSPVSGPAVEATLTAKELVAGAGKYEGKVIQVKGVVLTGVPGKPNPAITLAGTDTKMVVCVLAPGEFEKALKGGRGAEVEVKGAVTSATAPITLSDCTMGKVPAARVRKVTDFASEFASNAATAEAAHKDKYLNLSGKVESVADGKLVLVGSGAPKKPKGENPPKLVAHFGPDWKDALAKVKVGDDVTVSGQYLSHQPGEVSLSDCWLIRK